MRVVLVGRDAAPSQCFQKLAPALNKRGAQTQLFVGDGKPFKEPLDDIRAAVQNATVVVIGMSSSKELAEPEIVAATAALGAGIPYGFYLDIPRCANREWFGDLRDGAAFFFAPNEEDARRVMQLYPRARVIATGNPKREDSFFLPFTRKEVQSRLGVREDERVVLVSLGKSPMANAGVCERLYSAFTQFSEGEKKRLRVFLSFHPGDRTPAAVDPSEVLKLGGTGLSLAADTLGNPKAQLEIYNDLVKFAPQGIRVEILPTKRGEFSTDDAVPGVDLVAGYGSSTEMTAGAQRVPCITIGGVVARERNWSVTKSASTEAVEAGASDDAGNLDELDLTDRIHDLLYNSMERASAQCRQEAALPAPTERGASVAKMVKALEEVVLGSGKSSERAESCS